MTRSASMCNHCCYVLAPIMWIAHLLLASTLKAYHEIIPDNLVGGDWGLTQAGNRAGKTQPSMQMGAHGLESVFVVTCTEKLDEDFFKWLLELYPTTKTYPNIRLFRYPAMTSNIRLPFMATIGACLRFCALLRSEPQQKRNQAVPKKRLFFCRK